MTTAPKKPQDDASQTITLTDATSEEKPVEDVITRDKWEIWTLLALHYQPKTVERILNEKGHRISLFTFGPDASETSHLYRHNGVIPIPDVRDLIQAEIVFKRFIDSA